LHTELEDSDRDFVVGDFLSNVFGQPVVPGQYLSAEESTLVFDALSRREELAKVRLPGERLVWSRSDLSADSAARIARPWLDEQLDRWRQRVPVAAEGVPNWPENQPFALCLTHDMDHVTSFPGAEYRRQMRRQWREPGFRPARTLSGAVQASRATLSTLIRRDLQCRQDRVGNVGQWLKIEADCAFRSSLYFFSATVDPWHPFDCNYAFGDRVEFEGVRMPLAAMMREIDERGWEVSLHGSISSATIPGVLVRQKREIEEVIARPAETTRQHYLQYAPSGTAALQAEAGFVADGTQGFNDIIGYRAGTSFPYRVWDWSTNCALPLLQFPLHIQDGPLLRSAPTVERAVETCSRFLDQVQATGGCLGLLFHPASLSTDRGQAVYREVLQEAHRRGAWGCSMREAAQWWLARSRRIEAKSRSIPA
jgi:hypothetical protein